MKKLSNREMLEAKYKMYSISKNNNVKEMGIPKYIEQIGQEVERTLYQGIIVPSFMRDLFLDNSLKMIQTVQIYPHMIIVLSQLLKRLSNYKCDERDKIKADSSLDTATKKKLLKELDKLFKEKYSKIRIAISTLESKITSIRIGIKNGNLDTTPLAIDGSNKKGLKQLKNEIENNIKQMLCNSLEVINSDLIAS